MYLLFSLFLLLNILKISFPLSFHYSLNLFIIVVTMNAYLLRVLNYYWILYDECITLRFEFKRLFEEIDRKNEKKALLYDKDFNNM